jgi:hypothetical protein
MDKLRFALTALGRLAPTPLPEGEGILSLLPWGEGGGMREGLKCFENI